MSCTVQKVYEQKSLSKNKLGIVAKDRDSIKIKNIFLGGRFYIKKVFLDFSYYLVSFIVYKINIGFNRRGSVQRLVPGW